MKTSAEPGVGSQNSNWACGDTPQEQPPGHIWRVTDSSDSSYKVLYKNFSIGKFLSTIRTIRSLGLFSLFLFVCKLVNQADSNSKI